MSPATTRWVFDLKNDWQFRKRTGLHSRCYFGIVASSIEDQSAPLEKQFFVGGPNSMRGWSALRLGPGSSTNENLNVRGDMKIELNLEARHYLNDWIQVATFVDAGNVWMTREEENRPNVHFEWDRFLSEMAVSVGGGVRLDFGYFMLRCDCGNPHSSAWKTGTNSKWLADSPRGLAPILKPVNFAPTT